MVCRNMWRQCTGTRIIVSFSDDFTCLIGCTNVPTIAQRIIIISTKPKKKQSLFYYFSTIAHIFFICYACAYIVLPGYCSSTPIFLATQQQYQCRLHSNVRQYYHYKPVY